jgi:hypothetical protein
MNGTEAVMVPLSPPAGAMLADGCSTAAYSEAGGISASFVAAPSAPDLLEGINPQDFDFLHGDEASRPESGLDDEASTSPLGQQDPPEQALQPGSLAECVKQLGFDKDQFEFKLTDLLAKSLKSSGAQVAPPCSRELKFMEMASAGFSLHGQVGNWWSKAFKEGGRGPPQGVRRLRQVVRSAEEVQAELGDEGGGLLGDQTLPLPGKRRGRREGRDVRAVQPRLAVGGWHVR